MSFTTFTGPVRAGTVREGSGRNTGVVVLSQSFPFTYANSGAFSTGIILPAGSQIIDLYVDTYVAWDTGTSSALEIGTTGNADEYGDVTNLKATAGRQTVAKDVTQLAVLKNIGTTDKPVILTITNDGATTAGSALFTVVYAQRAADGSINPTSA